MPWASAASMRRAVRMSSLARDLPISRGSRWVPPAPGMMASEVSVSPSCACGAAMRRSQASKSSVPPPKAKPLTTPIVGCGSASRSSIVRRMFLTKIGTRSSGMVRRSFRSAPAQNDFSPAPVIRIARTDRSWRSSSNSVRSLRSVGNDRQFMTSGRLMVSVMTSPSRSMSTSSGWSGTSVGKSSLGFVMRAS